MQLKAYEIEGAKYFLKEDLTLEESEQVQKLMNTLYTAGNNPNENYPSGEIRKFLALVLEQTESSIAETDFGKVKESIALEVIKDFFLRRMRLTLNTADYFRSLMKEQNLLQEDIPN